MQNGGRLWNHNISLAMVEFFSLALVMNHDSQVVEGVIIWRPPLARRVGRNGRGSKGVERCV